MNSTNEYNDEPVLYCKSCLSLRIKTVVAGLNLDYCDVCGSTEIDQTHISNWEELHRKTYGFDYLTNKLNDNGRDSRI